MTASTAATAGSSHRWLQLGGGLVDLVTGEVRLGARVDRLTRREADVLEFLARRPGRSVTRDELLSGVFRDPVSVRAVDSAVARLRNKIEREPSRPEHVISVYTEGYRFEPPSAPAPTVRVAVPQELTPLVGRAAALAEVVEALGAGRLVTLTGPGGVGKTRVAARVAGEVIAERVIWVGLAHATTPAQAVGEVARAIDAPVDGADTASAARIVGRSLVGGVTVLVLDNLEQLEGAGALIHAWLLAAPQLRVLATSRSRLDVDGEAVVRVPTLAPDAAVALFGQRAQALGAPIGAAHDEAVLALVDALDRLPLAVELAAARSRALSPVQMLDRLGPRLLSGRDGSLVAAFDWSWELLGDADRRVLAALSVFPGRILPEAARAVAGPDADAALFRLDAASMVFVTDGGYALLSTVRDWAAGKARAIGVLEQAELAHATFYADWLEAQLPDPASTDGPALDRVEVELAHLLVAPTRVRAVRPDLAVRITLLLWDWYQYRGAMEPYLELADLAVELAGAMPHPARARALRARATSLRLLGRTDDAERDLLDALDEAERARDEATASCLRFDLGGLRMDRGRLDEAVQWLARARPGLSGRLAAIRRGQLACVALQRLSPTADTERELRGVIDDAEAHGWRFVAMSTLGNLAVLLTMTGRGAEAEPLLVEAIARLRAFGAPRQLVSCLVNLAELRMLGGRLDDADRTLAEAEELARQMGRAWIHGVVIATRGALALGFGDPDDGLRRLDEADRVFTAIENPVAPRILDAYRAALLAAVGQVGAASAALVRAREGLVGVPGYDGLVDVAEAHVAAARWRSGGDRDEALHALARGRAAAPRDVVGRFLATQLPADLDG